MAYPEHCNHVGDGCPEKPHLHWHKPGSCGVGHHSKCARTFSTFGKRKTLNCPCECHNKDRWRRAADLGRERTMTDVLSNAPRTM